MTIQEVKRRLEEIQGELVQLANKSPDDLPNEVLYLTGKATGIITKAIGLLLVN